MLCEKCKTQLPDGAKFCCECGNPVVKEGISRGKSDVEGSGESLEEILEDFADTLDGEVKKLQGIFTDENIDKVSREVFSAIDSFKDGANALVTTVGISLVLGKLAGEHLFAGSNKFYFRNNIPADILRSALKTYGDVCGVKEEDVFLLCDDTILMDKGTIGFIVSYDGIATSRKEMVKFSEIKKMYLDGYKILVDKCNGSPTEVYEIDGLNEKDRETLNYVLGVISGIVENSL